LLSVVVVVRIEENQIAESHSLDTELYTNRFLISISIFSEKARSGKSDTNRLKLQARSPEQIDPDQPTDRTTQSLEASPTAITAL